MNSFNHYSLGSCTQWMYEYCLGIRPGLEKPGFKKVTFAPFFDFSQKIMWAEGYYDTDCGRISVSWKNDADAVKYTVTLPAEIECDFDFGSLKIINKSFKNNTYEFLLQK